ncbi:MAG: hypothetical protein RLZZ526_1921 [Actinomycetota bacterium]|jgi:predicted nucleic acid-binding Zn ribbon protein
MSPDDRPDAYGEGAEEVHPDDIPAGPKPRSLGDLLGRYLGRVVGKDAPAAKDLFSQWRTVVGDTVADNVTPVRLERGVLTVEVVENAWATQLKFLERQLLNTLREHVGDVVDSLEVKVRRSR